MSRFRKLSHSLWHCQYHAVIVPKYRYRILEGEIATEVTNCVRLFSAQEKGSSRPLTFDEFPPDLFQVLLQRSVLIFPCLYPLNNTAYRTVTTYLKMSADTGKCIADKS
jgi:hypothetical protein